MEKRIKKIFEGLNFGERDIDLLNGYVEGHDLIFKIKGTDILLADKDNDEIWANNIDEILESLYKFNREINIDGDCPDKEKFEDDETIINIMEDLYTESKKYIFTKDEFNILKDLINSIEIKNSIQFSIYTILKNMENQLDSYYTNYIKNLVDKYNTINPIDILEIVQKNTFINSNYIYLVKALLSLIDSYISNNKELSNIQLELLTFKKNLFDKYFSNREIKEERDKIYTDVKTSLVILKVINTKTKSETLFSFFDIYGNGEDVILNIPEGLSSLDKYKLSWTTREERIQYLKQCITENKTLNKLIAIECIFKEKENEIK